jgi:hypothetical protein
LRADLGKPDKPKPTPPTAPTDIDGICKPNVEGFTEGVSYVRLKGPKRVHSHLQISQIVVIDTKGNNVALKKPATISSKFPTGVHQDQNGIVHVDPNWAVDGKLTMRYGGAGIVISDEWPVDKDPWWMVDLQGEFDIKQVNYWNRDVIEQRAIGVEIQLLDSEKNVIKSYKITNVKKIYCVNTI